MKEKTKYGLVRIGPNKHVIVLLITDMSWFIKNRQAMDKVARLELTN